MYTVPPPNAINLWVDNEAKRRSLDEQDRLLKSRDWLNTDPGRGPVRGFNGGRWARAAGRR